MKPNPFRIIVAAFILVAVSLACSGTTPQEVMDDARTTATMQAAETQAYILINGGTATQGPGPTNTLASGEIVQTNIAATYAAQTRIPTFTSTPVPTSTRIVVVYSPTPGTNATATVVVASEALSVYNAVVTGCETGAPYVQVGPVTIPCDQKVIPAPVSYTDAPAGYQTGNITTDDECMTDGEMFAAHGFSANGIKAVFTGQNIVWDSCKWNLQAVGIGTYWQPFLDTWEYTVTEANGKVSVNKGPGGKWVYGATARQLDAMTDPAEYWVHDDVVLMAREFNFGYGRDLRYGTVPGVNLDLRGEWNQPNIKATCPADAVQAAAMLGGDDPKFWTAPTWARGAWTFNSKGEGFHHFTWTGGSEAFFTVWTAENGVIDVNAANKSIFTKKNFEDGSYHCVPE